MAVEVFANSPVTTVTSGGTDAPAQGTQETWIVANAASFPSASSSAEPPTWFHIADTVLSSELVTVVNTSGNTFTVLRGAEGTVPVAHSNPFTIYQVVSAGALAQLSVLDWLNVVTMFQADHTGTNDSTTAINNAIAAASTTLQTVYFPAGTYKISSALNWKIAGLSVRGDGSASTVIKQVTANTPILQLAGQGQWISGLNLRYSSQEPSANTSSIAMEFGDDTVGSCFESVFQDIYIELCNTALAINPSIATVAGLFSCLFENIHVLGYSYRAINLIGGNGVGAGATGCVFNNTYLGNSFTGSDATASSWPVFLQVWSECVFNQLNIEHCSLSADACVFSQCGNIVINGLHLEHLEVSGTPGYGLVGIGTGTGAVVINGMSVEFCTFSGSSYDGLFRVTGGSNQNVILNGLYAPAASNTDSTSAIPLIDFNSATGVDVQVSGISSTASQIYTENYANAGSGCSGVITDGSQITYFPSLTWTSFPTGNSGNNLNATSGTAQAPVTGTWYYAQMYVPWTFTATGLIASVPSGENGTTKWNGAIWNSSGTLMTSSATAGTTTPAANETFKLPFSAATSLPGPAVYFAGIQTSATAPSFEAFNNNAEGFIVGDQAGTFGTIVNITTPSTGYTVNTGPMLKTY
jgi:hypothetical protein